MSADDVKIKDWDTFHSIVGKHVGSAPSMNDMLYRGQSSSKWRLESSFARLYRSLYEINGVLQPFAGQNAIATEKLLTDSFRKHKHISGTASLPHGILDAWAMMQHHGCPTRLLDWTESPYVAAYFAVRENLNDDGAVFMFSRKLLSRINQDKGVQLPDRHDEERFFSETSENASCILEPPNLSSPRMLLQQGAFLVSKFVLADYSAAANDLFTGMQGAFRKLTIPLHLKIEFLCRLANMTITGSNLFGENLDGLCLSLREKALMESRNFKIHVVDQFSFHEHVSVHKTPVPEE